MGITKVISHRAKRCPKSEKSKSKEERFEKNTLKKACWKYSVELPTQLSASFYAFPNDES